MKKAATHIQPKTEKSFNRFTDQKSTTVLWSEGDITMIRRKNSTQQWNKRGSKWHLAGFS